MERSTNRVHSVRPEPTVEQVGKLIEAIERLMRGECVKLELTYRKTNRAIRIQEVTATEH